MPVTSIYPDIWCPTAHMNEPPIRKTRPKPQAFAIAITLLASAAALIAYPAAYAAGDGLSAHAATTIQGTATAHLRLVRAEGSELFEEGPVSGALVGSSHAQLHTGSVFTASFTIRTSAGSISGHGQANPRGSGRYQSFAGTFLATGGTGRYAHIRGSSGLYGVFDRRTDAVTIQATGGKLAY
jgi:hypothetical protein